MASKKLGLSIREIKRLQAELEWMERRAGRWYTSQSRRPEIPWEHVVAPFDIDTPILFSLYND